MPRSSSSRRSGPAPNRSGPPPQRNYSAPPPKASAPPPAPVTAPSSAMSTPAPQGGGMLAGLGATMAQGFAFGTGSALAREAVGSIMGSGRTEHPAPVAPQQPIANNYSGPKACEMDHSSLMQCMQQNQSSVTNCELYFNALQACQQRN